MTIGIILAAGKGTRLACTDKNKTSLELHGKPLVQYGVELYQKTVDHTIIVVGAFAESVKDAVHGENIDFAEQTEQHGTGHAAQVAVKKIQELGLTPSTVFLGYGDHMTLYTPEVLNELAQKQRQAGAAIGLITAIHEDPNSIAWGRVLRDEHGFVTEIVEQKDATDEQKLVTEVNAGFYVFEYDFLSKAVFAIEPSAVTGEYYLTDLIAAAKDENRKIVAHSIPFSQVGSGINTREQLEAAEELLKQE
jgi:bifunctional UDP-N-acetylglucosamine pyrophosphorylase/glucosamine-1-phosphate N-acetyltransferase